MQFRRKPDCKDGVLHTIRFSGLNYDFILDKVEENEISINNVVNQMVQFFRENNM